MPRVKNKSVGVHNVHSRHGRKFAAPVAGVTALTATVHTGTETTALDLAWTAPARGTPSTYTVWRDNVILSAAVDGAEVSYADSGLTTATTYRYRVVAFYTGGLASQPTGCTGTTS